MTRTFGCLLLVLTLGNVARAGDSAEHFDAQIAPLLAARCLQCHSGPEPKGGLDLASKKRAFAGGESGTSIVPGQPGDSLLWQRIEDGEMPPKTPLSKDEKSLLRKWIEKGAVWGSATIDPFRFTTTERGGYDWWSLQPIKEVVPPTVKTSWGRNPIDAFIAKALNERQLSPSPMADPRQLVRRLYFDLLGLPPEPETVAAFAADPSETAYQALVTRLLESPHYGERWGRHWLDVVRYGESDGFERNTVRQNLWPYRDWVISALNQDMPYDEFVRQQLAGDLSNSGRPGLAAVGFLVAGVHNTVVGGSERMKLLARQDELEEIVGTVGQTFLGLTINCARCHDHKFDPIRTDEYYSMIATIDGVSHGEREIPQPQVANRLAQIRTEATSLQSRLDVIDTAARERILAERKKKPQEPSADDLPQPYARWEFDNDFRDGLGSLHAKAHGGAKLDGGALLLNGTDAYVSTSPLDQELAAKTLEAWVQLDNLDQRGGAAISVQTIGGQVFDAIVFGEREPQRWMAGSNVFARTQSFHGSPESAGVSQPIHFAIVYSADGTITGYRNGEPYGKPYKTGLQRFESGKAEVLFGLRHGPPTAGRFLKGRVLRAQLYDRALTPQAVAASAGRSNAFVSEKALVASLSAEQRQTRADLQNQIAALKARQEKLESQAKQKIYTVVPRTPKAMRVHVRGSVTDYGKEVAPAGVAAVGGLTADFQLPKEASDRDRREKLAEWVTNANNPLFARVMVNRVWHYHFGTGLVDTPNDLGFNGGRPSHPELIDWLAGQFQDSGYRLKPLHRLIVSSATYRQSSRQNPDGLLRDRDNRLLWRYPPRRVEAEVLRDGMLQVAGVLNPKQGGPGFEDVKIVPNNGTVYYEPIDPEGPEFHRRTIYRFTPRGGRSAVLDTFDCPDPSSAAPRRSVTTTPLQALSLLNNSFVLRMADRFAARVKQEAGDSDAARIRRAWQLALNRDPEPNEQEWAAELVSRHGLASLCRALFNTNEFVVIQ